jgi:hypothetical protein
MKQLDQLGIERCPHCNVAKPLVHRVWGPAALNDHAGKNGRIWSSYRCATCGGVVLVWSWSMDHEISQIWPTPQAVSEHLPERARDFLEQAIASVHAPAGAVMLTASAVDAMLKDKCYKTGSLNTRIDTAATDHLITSEMAAWAHEIRLDANDQRHADEDAGLPTAADAEKAIEFAQALAQFLYVLPARVARGRKPPTP